MNPDERSPGDNINPKSNASVRAAFAARHAAEFRAFEARYELEQATAGPSGTVESSSSEEGADEVSFRYDGLSVVINLF